MGQSKLDNPEKLARYGTQDKEKKQQHNMYTQTNTKM
jgi:hypothetical protein